MFRVPYRWPPRTFTRNIQHMWLDLTTGVNNILRWSSVIWFDADYDWIFLNTILEYKFKRMAKVLEHGHLANGERYARQLRVCAALCSRMRDDNGYYENADKRFTVRGLDWANHITKQQRNDQRLLGLMIAKYYRHWWD